MTGFFPVRGDGHPGHLHRNRRHHHVGGRVDHRNIVVDFIRDALEGARTRRACSLVGSSLPPEGSENFEPCERRKIVAPQGTRMQAAATASRATSARTAEGRERRVICSGSHGSSLTSLPPSSYPLHLYLYKNILTALLIVRQSSIGCMSISSSYGAAMVRSAAERATICSKFQRSRCRVRVCTTA